MNVKWLRSWLKSKRKHAEESVPPPQEQTQQPLLLLKGRTIQKNVVPVTDMTILETALKHKVDWNSLCKKGTCARCRCHVEAGMPFLSEPNDAEKWRLTKEEIEAGFRLGCQTKVVKIGKITVKHHPYF